MDSTVVVFTVLGAALVVAIIALVLYKPAEKADQPPQISRKHLEKLYEEQHGKSPDFEGDYLREKKRKSRGLDAAAFVAFGPTVPLVANVISVLRRPFRSRQKR